MLVVGNKTHSFYSEDCFFFFYLQTKMLRKKCWWSETKPTLSIQRIILFTQQAGVCLECCVVSAGKSVVRVLCCISR